MDEVPPRFETVKHPFVSKKRTLIYVLRRKGGLLNIRQHSKSISKLEWELVFRCLFLGNWTFVSTLSSHSWSGQSTYTIIRMSNTPEVNPEPPFFFPFPLFFFKKKKKKMGGGKVRKQTGVWQAEKYGAKNSFDSRKKVVSILSKKLTFFVYSVLL